MKEKGVSPVIFAGSVVWLLSFPFDLATVSPKSV